MYSGGWRSVNYLTSGTVRSIDRKQQNTEVGKQRWAASKMQKFCFQPFSIVKKIQTSNNLDTKCP